jgi:hypothetical protein
MQGPDPQYFYPGKDADCPSAGNKGHLWQCGEREAGLQGSLHPKWHSAPSLSVDSRKARQGRIDQRRSRGSSSTSQESASKGCR